MKKIAVLLSIMCFGTYLMLTEKDKKKIKKSVKKILPHE